MTVNEVIFELKKHANEDHLAKLSHFKTDSKTALGVKIPVVRSIAKVIKKDHDLALKLWETEIHEARILATMIADENQIDEKLFDTWVADFQSWDLCDQACFNVLEKVSFADKKIYECAAAEEEFVKRTAFTLIAGLAIHNKKLEDKDFTPYLSLIEKHSDDDRNFVKKAVNWALRQIGKRNANLNKEALKTAYQIIQQESKSAKWIAKDAIRELESEKVNKFIKNHRK